MLTPDPVTELHLPEGTSILVVDDSINIAFVLKCVFEQCGATVYLAEDAEGAIRMARDESPHLILMDMRLPDMSGLEAAGVILAAGYQGRLIAMTALADDRSACLRAGFDEYLGKPLDIDRLLRVVRRLLDSASADSREPASAQLRGRQHRV